SASVARSEIEAPSMLPRDALDDGEPQASAASARARRLASGERPLQSLDILGRDAWPAVGDFQHDRSGVEPCRDLDRWVAVGECIVEQVADQSRDGGGAQRCRRQVACREAQVAAVSPLPLDQRCHDVVQVARLERYLPLVAREIEELTDDLV